MTGLVFVLLLPVIVIVAGTWAWRYQQTALSLTHRPDRDGGNVALTDVSLPQPTVARLTCESPTHRLETHLVALESGPTLATLQAWVRDRTPLFETLDDGHLELVRLDGPGAVTLRRLPG